MRRLLLLLLIVSVAAIVLYRQRLYLRDPLGKMYVGDAQVLGARVFINYSNDVLVVPGDGAAAQTLIVQGWDRMPGVPQVLSCMRAMACLMPADQAPKIAFAGPAYDPRTSMSNREVSFTNAAGTPVRVVLR